MSLVSMGLVRLMNFLQRTVFQRIHILAHLQFNSFSGEFWFFPFAGADKVLTMAKKNVDGENLNNVLVSVDTGNSLEKVLIRDSRDVFLLAPSS